MAMLAASATPGSNLWGHCLSSIKASMAMLAALLLPLLWGLICGGIAKQFFCFVGLLLLAQPKQRIG
jgi:hypothetical protein